MPIEKRLLFKAVEAPEEVADTALSLRRQLSGKSGTSGRVSRFNERRGRLAGKDMWNGPSDTHFGRRFFTITGTRR